MSLSKSLQALTERLDSLVALHGCLPTQGLSHDHTTRIARRLISLGFSTATICLLTGISRRSVSRLRLDTPLHPLLDDQAANEPLQHFHPKYEEECIWSWYTSTEPRWIMMALLARRLRVPIDEVLVFFLTAFHGPHAYALRVCRLCERPTPRRRGESNVCIVCRKQGFYARDKARRQALSHLD